jgi:hypothetical protein
MLYKGDRGAKYVRTIQVLSLRSLHNNKTAAIKRSFWQFCVLITVIKV